MITPKPKRRRPNLIWVTVIATALIVSYSSVCTGGDCFVFKDHFEDGAIGSAWSTYSSTTASFAETGGTMQITADGADIWADRDEYGAVYTSAAGDFDAIVKVVSQTNTHAWAKAGIVVRNDITQPGNSPGYVCVLITPANGYALHWDYSLLYNSPKISALRTNTRFPGNPNGWSNISSFQSADSSTNYGQRIYGSIWPTDSGFYQFQIASHDNGELWLNNGSGLALIASVPGWTNPLEYTKYPQQTSAEVYLEGGGAYYIEALHKQAEHSGGNLSVQWKTPGASSFVLLPGSPTFRRQRWTGGWTNGEDGFLSANANSGTSSYPSWLRLSKRGTTFTGYYSQTGPSGPWTSVGNPITTGTADTTQHVGMIASSHVAGTSGTVVFDDFVLSGRTIDIDVWPNQNPNRISLRRSTTVVSVAILGSDTLNVNDLDQTTARFGKNGTEASPVNGPAVTDVNGDGHMDIVYGFRVGDCGFVVGDTRAVVTIKVDTTGLELSGQDNVIVN